MASNDAGEYEVIYSEQQLQHVRTLAARARSARQYRRFMRALHRVNKDLAQDPIHFGDQTHTLHALELPIFIRICSIIFVTYGVNESLRQVYIRSIDLYPLDLGEQPG